MTSLSIRLVRNKKMPVRDGTAQRFFACHVNSELINFNTILMKYSNQRIYETK